MGGKLLFGLILCATALGTAPLPASAAERGPVAIHEQWVDELSGPALVCDGVVLEYSGRVRTLIHVVEHDSGAFHVVIRWNSMGVRAVAADGTVYRDITGGMESKGATDEWVVDDDTGTFTENAQERIRVFAPGGDSVLLSREFRFHITKVDGVLRVVRDTITESCDPGT